MRSARVIDLGVMDYQEAFDFQKTTLEEVLSGAPHTLILVEHPMVHTLGANFHPENLLHEPQWYADHNIAIHKTDRGGDITHHGPGQLVIYPIFAIEEFGRDLHKWLRNLEEVMIGSCGAFGLHAERSALGTGVWIGEGKVAAIGIKVRKWVNLHGIALNCCNPLWPFETIIPCGLAQPKTTSLSVELGRQVSVDEVKPHVVKAFGDVFGICV